MNQNCEVIRDLLLLYEEDACSEATKKFVEEHLLVCEDCRKYREALKFSEHITVPEIEEDDKTEKKVISRSFRKIKRRWVVSIIAILMIFPIAGLGFLGVNEYKKEGICFSNLQEIAQCKKWVEYIEEGKFEEAAEMMNFYYGYADIRESYEEMKTLDVSEAENAERFKEFEEFYADVLGMSFEEYEEYCRAEVVRRLNIYEERGYQLEYRGFSDAFWSEDGWQISVHVREGDYVGIFTLCVNEDGLVMLTSSTSGSYLAEEAFGRIYFE